MRLKYSKLTDLFKEAESLWPGKAKWIVAALTILGSLLELAGVAVMFKLLLYVIDSAKSGAGHAILVAAGSFIFFALKNLALHKIDIFRSRKLQELYRNYSIRLFEHYFYKGYTFIKEQGVSSLSHNVNSVCYTFVFGYVNALLSLLSDTLLILLIVVVLFWVNAGAAVAEIVIFVPMVFLFAFITGEKMRRAGKEDNIAKRKQWKITAETFRGYPDIAVGNVFGEIRNIFKSGLEQISGTRIYTDRLKSISGRSVEMGLVAIIAILIIIFGVVYGGKPLSQTLIPIIAIFTAATLKMLPAVRSVLSNLDTLRNTSYSVDMIRSEREWICGVKIEEPAPEGCKLECSVFESLELKDVDFSFGDGTDVLKGFSMKIQRGERVGIRGISGSGKSTLMLLILGIYKPDSGVILLNGIDLGLYNLKSWHKLTGYVSQDSFLLDASIARNITLRDDDLTPDVREVLKMVSLDDFVSKLNSADSWRPGEGGVLLSGGERQRLAIARALFKSAGVLLLDEATSALDSDTERKIIDTLTGLDKTIIIISHREKMLEICNRITDVGPIT
ncbi:MAG: ABC transporter ATP-binding protein [Bacteroidales bacterium]|jgi:ABC-type multidrug transport system fused ATPase/permease subunit